VREFQQAKVSGAIKARVETSGMFGARPVLSWTNSEAGARLTLPFTVESSGRHAVRLTAATAPDFGVFDVELDGKRVTAAPIFAQRMKTKIDLALGTHELNTGTHTLSFLALATHDAEARPLAVEMLRLLPLPPEAQRPIKTRHEAHFIRLGIGRAILRLPIGLRTTARIT
jgi:hypothetical protein